MVRVQLIRGFRAEQIEFPDELSEDLEGAMHFARGKVVALSDAQLQWLEDNRPKFHACLKVLPEPRVPTRTKRKLESAAKAKAKKTPESNAQAIRAQVEAKLADGRKDALEDALALTGHDLSDYPNNEEREDALHAWLEDNGA